MTSLALGLGRTLCLAVVAYLCVQLVRFGFLPSYWRRRGWFRWHMASGIVISMSASYAAFCFLFQRPAAFIPAVINAVATIVCCVSGLRMVVLVKQRDLRTRRFFANNGLAIMAMGLLELGIVCRRLPSPAWATWSSRAGGLIALVTASAAMLLGLRELALHLRPLASAAIEVHHPEATLTILDRHQILALFRDERRGESSSTLYYSRLEHRSTCSALRRGHPTQRPLTCVSTHWSPDQTWGIDRRSGL